MTGNFLRRCSNSSSSSNYYNRILFGTAIAKIRNNFHYHQLLFTIQHQEVSLQRPSPPSSVTVACRSFSSSSSSSLINNNEIQLIQKQLQQAATVVNNKKRRGGRRITKYKLAKMKKLHDINEKKLKEYIRQEEEIQKRRRFLFYPDPMPNPPGHVERVTVIPFDIRYPKDFNHFVWGVKEGWKDYISTWDGFFDNITRAYKENDNDDDDSENNNDEKKKKKKKSKNSKGTKAITEKGLVKIGEEEDEDEGKNTFIKNKTNEIKSNVNRNVEFLKDEGEAVLDNVKRNTGIYTQEDLKNFISEQIKFATSCIKEFMSGYRKGRDDEIDKMMNEYFQENDDDDDSKKKKELSLKDFFNNSKDDDDEYNMSDLDIIKEKIYNKRRGRKSKRRIVNR